MAARYAWVLNLDADDELAAGDGYSPKRAVVAATRERAKGLIGSLVSASDLLVQDDTPPGAARGLTGRAFCPTPRATRALAAAGAEVPAHPPVEVLRTVNSRAFNARLGLTLPASLFTHDATEAKWHVESAPPFGRGWRMKRAFGMAGRAQRLSAFPPSDGDHAFIERATATGGVQLEPNVTITEEYGVHGWVEEDGSRSYGALVRQICDGAGAWLRSEALQPGAVPADVAVRIAEEAERAATALHRSGYFGPFGIDAFRYDGGGELALQPRSEINARYSMGFAVGFPLGCSRE